MAYRAFVSTQTAMYFIPSGGGYDHHDLDKAKAATALYIANNKTNFQNGYDAYVLDMNTHKVVSFATIPQPTLNWEDATPPVR